MSINTINPGDFFGTGLSTINSNFSNLQTIAQSLRASDDNSGLTVPVLMVQGTSAQYWVKPLGVNGPYVVLDHGILLGADQYSEANGIITLSYTPSAPLAISIAWCTTKGGITRPIPLIQSASLGIHYWGIPAQAGPNILVFDQGAIVARENYSIVNGNIFLTYTPMNGSTGYPDIKASWGAGGPGMVPPRKLARLSDTSLDLKNFLVPQGAGDTIWIFDHGFALDVSDFTINSGIITLNYTPAEPLKIYASWGYRTSGLFFQQVSVTPAPDGTNNVFTLAQEPTIDTLSISALLADGATSNYYDPYLNFTVEGRTLTFLAGFTPPAGSTLEASMMTSVFTSPSQAITSGSGDVVLEPSIVLVTEKTIEEILMNSDGTIQKVTFRDNGSIVATISWTYTTFGGVLTRVDTGAGTTVTRTYTYDSSNNLLGATKVIV